MADPNPPGARPGASPRPIGVGQRPTGSGPPAADPAPLAPAASAAPPARSSGARAGPAVSAARTSGQRAGLGATPAAASGSHAAAPLSAEIQARTSGLKLRVQPQDVKQRLREGALDTVLNTAGILADTWDDFRNRDRYFKYKAAIIAGWVFLTVTSFFVAFPGGGGNRLGARLVDDVQVAGRPVYMIVNDSSHPWHEVTIVVNGRYRTAVGTVEGNGGTLTFNLKQLKGDNDVAAPPDMSVTDLQLRTDDGNAWLKKDGEKR